MKEVYSFMDTFALTSQSGVHCLSNPDATCIHHLFEAQVEQTPDAPALVFEDQYLTYRELNRRANQLGHYLGLLGVGPEVLVGLCMERSLEMIIGILAVLKAGGAYVPLDPAYPTERLVFMLQDSQITVLLTQEQLRSRLPACSARMVCLDTDWKDIAEYSETRVVNEVAAKNLAYVIYTSGSTGKPKGVCCSHFGVTNLLSDFDHKKPFTTGEHCSLWTSINFDVSIYEIFSSLCTGGALYLVPETIRSQSVAFFSWLESHCIQSAYIAPFMLIDLARWLRQDRRILPLKRLLVGVEPIQEQLLQQISQLIPGLQIINGYGPTEATVCVTLYKVGSRECFQRITPLGLPVQNIWLYVLDEQMQLVPIGTPGELYIGGAGLAQGYLNRPELTAERFIPDSFGNQPGARLYCTGDRVRSLPDGNLEFVGRLDQQVKIRGFRVELGEIEAILIQHPAVREAVVVAQEDAAGDKHLVAYLVGIQSSVPSSHELRSYLQEQLPDYMLPTVFIALDALPLTPNDKIDRRALPAVDFQKMGDKESYVAPRTQAEKVLAQIYASVFKRERISVDANFFELGGHSLLATQIIARVREQLHSDIPVQQFFALPRLADLARWIEEKSANEAVGTADLFHLDQHEGQYALSYMQRQLWFLEQLAPGNSMHNIPVAVYLEGKLDCRALEQSIQQIVQRHDCLRTLFVEQGGVPQQQVLSVLEIPVQRVEIVDELHGEKSQVVQQRLVQEAQRPFNLSEGPLLRVTLFRLAPEQHVLLLVLHHMITDGWSMGVLFQELEMLYRAYCTGETMLLPELPIQYIDFTRWQQQSLQGDYREQLVTYWKAHLQGAPSLVPLPTDRPRPSRQTFQGAIHTFRIAEDQRHQLEMLGRRAEATLFMSLLSVFQVLLYRYTGEEQLVVGTPVANRTQRQMEPLIGFFVNTLALHTQLHGDLTFRELLARVKQVTLGAYAHQDLPFNVLVEELQPERDTCYNPVFQVVFALQTAAMELKQLHNLRVSSLPIHTQTSQFDLMLEMREEGNGLVGAFEYNTDLFDTSTIERMTNHFQQLLMSILADPDQPIARLSLLSESERYQLLVSWNQTQREYPGRECIHELFEEQVRRNPTAIAVIWEEEEVSYGELNTRADRLAQRLRGLGVGPDVLVGLYVRRSVEMVVGLLGILKAGGAYVPLDPTYPEERQAFMIQDAAIKVLLTQTDVPFPAYEGSVLYIDADLAYASQGQEFHLETPARPTAENLAYVMYTSGSTGRPKGVAIEHRSIVRLLFGVDYVRLDASQRILHMASSSFDAATFELWGALLHGGTCILYPDQLPTAQGIQKLVQKHHITTMWITSSLFNAIIDEDPAALAGVEQILTGGEALSVGHVSSALQALPDAQIINGYGPTENTTFTCCYPIPPSFATTARSVPIGRPIANTQVYILDAYLQPVPVGVAGELYIGGAGVARGYLHQPELTRQRFVADPFSQEPGACLYRTGDLVRYRADSTIEFLGRRDHQIKLRGFRIELGEIEAALARNPAVKECVVVMHEETPGDKRLVAYIVRNEEWPLSPEELFASLRQWLPDYMLPSRLLHIAALPLTANGKVDLQKLSQMASPFENMDTSSLTPRTPAEEIIANIWMDVLGVAHISIHDDFFALGGHSLLVTRVISRLREAFQVELPIATLFTARTVADLAQCVVQVQDRQSASVETMPLVASSCKEELPLSLAQERIWFLEQFTQENSAYLIASAYRLRGMLDLEVLQRSIQALVQRHESLRTIFPARDGRPVQKVQAPDEASCDLIQKDLEHLQQNEKMPALMDYVERQLRHPMDLAQGPLLQVHLLRLAPEEHVMLLVIHHIIADGWSLHILYRELSALYNDFIHQRQSGLKPSAIQFADYAIWERRWLQESLAQQELDYWCRQLADAPTLLDLPTDHPRPPVHTYTGASLSLHIASELTESLEMLSQQEGITLSMTLLAAFSILLSRYTGQEDILIGTPTAGRNRHELEDLIGLFVNILVIRTRLTDVSTLRDVLREVRETTLEAYAHQHLPFEQLLNQLHIERNLSRTSLFQVFFNMLNFPDIQIDFPDIEAEVIPLPMITSKFDMTIYVEKQKQGLRIELAYNADLFRQERMRELLNQFETLLSQMLRPETSLAELSLVTPEAREVLPDPREPLSSTWKGSVHTLLARQVQRIPDRVAVVDEWESITYGELWRRSTLLEQQLCQRGIGPSDVVAIYGQRNATLTWAVFGALKTGATLVILDPAYPSARLIAYLQLAEVRCLLVIPEREQDINLPLELEEYMLERPGRSCLYLSHTMFASSEAQSTASLIQDTTVGPDDIAFITFTSGSTGQPKAVQQRHGPLTHFLEWQQQRFQLEEHDHYSMFSGLAHDPLQREIFTSLCLGATLSIPSSELMGIPTQLVQWMDRQQVTIAHLTPAMMQLLTQSIAATSSGTPQVVSLRCAFTVGDALTGRDVARLWTLAPHVTCVNFYGSTETQRAVSYYIVPHPQEVSGIRPGKEVIPLGKGFQDVQLVILNQGGQMVGVSEVGEIYLRSPHLAKGYAHDLKTTQARFLVNPFTDEKGDYLYRTGDLGRYLPDGNVEYVGRKDQQIKLRGYRIELAEIEAVLRSHSQVQDVAVILREDTPGRRYLAAYIVPLPIAREEIMLGTQLRSFVAALLPTYMVPTIFQLLECLPLTPNLKVDRRALPAPNLSQNELSLIPRTPTEEILVGIWSEILEHERIGVQENFFELGGHSLLATQIISRVRDVFRLEIPLRALFEAPTIAAFAEWIEKMRGLAFEQQTTRILPVSRESRLPLSFAQQRLWFLDQLEPGTPLYNLHAALQMRGSLELAILEQSLNAIVRRHESLRTHFGSERGQAWQIIVPDLFIPLPVVDLSMIEDQQQREEEARHLALLEARCPFDLASGPLMRATLLKLGQAEYLFLLTAHHSILDGWSDRLFIKELTTFYTAFSSGQSPSLPVLPIHYADFAVWQRERVEKKQLEGQFEYWRQQLRDLPPMLPLSLADERPAIQSFRGSSCTFVLSPDLTRRIKALSRREGVTLFMVLLGAFDVLLHLISGQEDVIIGTPIAGRTQSETEQLIGLFVNTLALRVDLSGNPSFLEVLKRVRKVTLDAYDNQEIPFELLVDEVVQKRSLSHHPLFQTMFVLQNLPDEHLQLPGLTLDLMPIDIGGSLFDLTIRLQEDGPQLRGSIEYSTDLFTLEAIEELLEHFIALLEAVVDKPMYRLQDITLWRDEASGDAISSSETREQHYQNELFAFELE